MIKYLAGIFDAEGYVRIRFTNGKSYTPEARIYMCEKSIIKLFSDKYGLTIKTSLRGVNRKTAYYITFGVKELRNTSFISDILPYLNEKRPQLLEVSNLLFNNKCKSLCYKNYMLAKESFNHPIVGDLDYEYIAGVIDGDGWFTMFNAGKGDKISIMNRFSFGLEQRYKPMIEYMLKFGGHLNTRIIKDKLNHRQTYEWKISTRDMLDLLVKIEPFLIEKRKRCQDFITYINECNKFEALSKVMVGIRLDK